MIQSANQWLKKLRLDTLLDLTGHDAPEDGPQILLRIQVKTADYTVLLSDSGTLFTTYGDTGAIIFTLPAVIKKGFFALFAQSTDQNMTITAGTADTLIAKNNLAADGTSLVTSSNKIGALMLVFCDGNAYHAVNLGQHTETVVDA